MKNNVYTKKQLKQKATRGAVILVVRRVVYQLILTSSNIILARIFLPSIMGTFNIISFIILNIGILTNLGLSHAIIQKDKQIDKNELGTIMVTLLFASLLFILAINLLVPVFRTFYGDKLLVADIFWLRIFSVYILIVNLSAIFQSLLEKKLAYTKLVIGDLATVLITQSLIIILALAKMGVGSFVLGNIIGAAFGGVLYFLLCPAAVKINFSLANLRPFLNYGVNYQVGTLIAAVNSAVVPIFVGSVSGSEAVAYLIMAAGLSQGVVTFTEVIQRLAFSIGSRTAGNKDLLRSLIERLVRISCLINFPLLAVVYVLAPNIIKIIYTAKWLPMLTSLYVFIITAGFLVLSNLFIQFLLAVGKAQTVRNIMGLQAVLQWALTVPLVIFWNFNGAALASLLVSMTFFIPLIYLRKEFPFKLISNVLPAVIFTFATWLATFSLTKIIVPDSFFRLVLTAGGGFIFYILLLLTFERRMLAQEISELVSLKFPNIKL